MNSKKFLWSLLLVCTVVALFRRAFARPAVEKSGSSRGTYDEIDAYIKRQMRRLNIPGVSLAIVEGDRIVHYRGFGRARPGGEAPTSQTPFFIGSLTKSFTALAVMQLVEAGKIELDAPVQRYLTWFRVADAHVSAQMTVRHLLNQTSGLPVLVGEIDLTDFDDRPDAAEHRARALSNLKITRPSGTKFEYSNTNYNILGLIIEAASGESYHDYIQKHIFDPLDMKHSYAAKSAAQQNGLAVGHRYWFGRPIPAPNLCIPTSSLASGQLICSAEDMAHYLIANLNGGRYCGTQILSEDGIDELHRGVAEGREMGFLIGYYGMGWVSEEDGKSRIVSHSGTVPDFAAFMALVPEQNKGMILLVNANHVMMKLTLDEFGLSVAKQLAGEPASLGILGGASWAMRSLVLIPILQIAGVAATLRLIARWRADPATCPVRGRVWGQHILLPLIPNLTLAAILVYLRSSDLLRWMHLFSPDLAWIARISGGFAAIWAFLRTGLVLRALGKHHH